MAKQLTHLGDSSTFGDIYARTVADRMP